MPPTVATGCPSGVQSPSGAAAAGARPPRSAGPGDSAAGRSAAPQRRGATGAVALEPAKPGVPTIPPHRQPTQPSIHVPARCGGRRRPAACGRRHDPGDCRRGRRGGSRQRPRPRRNNLEVAARGQCSALGGRSTAAARARERRARRSCRAARRRPRRWCADRPRRARENARLGARVKERQLGTALGDCGCGRAISSARSPVRAPRPATARSSRSARAPAPRRADRCGRTMPKIAGCEGRLNNLISAIENCRRSRKLRAHRRRWRDVCVRPRASCSS